MHHFSSPPANALFLSLGSTHHVSLYFISSVLLMFHECAECRRRSLWNNLLTLPWAPLLLCCVNLSNKANCTVLGIRTSKVGTNIVYNSQKKIVIGMYICINNKYWKLVLACGLKNYYFFSWIEITDVWDPFQNTSVLTSDTLDSNSGLGLLQMRRWMYCWSGTWFAWRMIPKFGQELTWSF